MAEETFLPSIRPANGECTHRAQQSKQGKMSPEILYEKVAEGLLTRTGTEIQAQGQTSSLAGRLVGREHFFI
jgi:hypothetical protein